jgi:hypothetical protein
VAAGALGLVGNAGIAAYNCITMIGRMALLLTAVAALVLFIGFKWGITAVNSGTIERTKNPVLYWATMGLAAALFMIGLALAILENRI